MPWNVTHDPSMCSASQPWAVTKEGTGALVACHATKEKATMQQKALYASMPMSERVRKPHGDVPYADPGYLDDAGNQAKGDNGVARYPIDENHVESAWSYINMPKNQKGYTPEQLAEVKGKIRAAMKRFGHQVQEQRETDELPVHAAVETREVTVNDVNFPDRIITIRAVPYEQPAPVEYLGEVYQETFAAGSMDHLINRPGRVRVNRGHNKNLTVGKVIKFHPPQQDGLIADVRIAKTALGDDTLGLAAEDMLSSSIGFAALPAWQTIDRRAKTRRINQGHLDHISFVESPAYENADVLAVREAVSKQLNDSELIDLITNILVKARPPEQRSTPVLDELAGDEMFRWASERLNRESKSL